MNIFEKINAIAADSRKFGQRYAVHLTEAQCEGLDLPSWAGIETAEALRDFGAVRDFLGLDDKAFITPCELAPDEVETELLRAAQAEGFPVVAGNGFVMVAPAAVELYALSVQEETEAVEIDSDNGKRGGYDRPDMMGIDWPSAGHLDSLARASARVRRVAESAAKYPAARGELARAEAEYHRLKRTTPVCEFGAGYPDEVDESAARKSCLRHYGPTQGRGMDALADMAWAEHYRQAAAVAKEYAVPVHSTYSQVVTELKAALMLPAKGTLAPNLAALVAGIAAEIWAGRRHRATLKLADAWMSAHKQEPLPLGSDLETEQDWLSKQANVRDWVMTQAARKLAKL